MMDIVQSGQGMPKICIPIVERTAEEIREAAGRLQNSVADLVEWRVDYFQGMTDTGMLKSIAAELQEILGGKAVLFTIRSLAEGGEREISFEEYAAILREAAAMSGIAYIDVEIYSGARGQAADAWMRPEDACHHAVRELVQDLKQQVRVIGSYHDFEQTPSRDEIVRRLVNSSLLGADIPKLAVMPNSRKDVMTLMEGTLEAKETLKGVPLITMSMGALGGVSRIAGESFGSAMTFACMGKASAPGQMEAAQLKQMLELLHVEEER